MNKQLLDVIRLDAIYRILRSRSDLCKNRDTERHSASLLAILAGATRLAAIYIILLQWKIEVCENCSGRWIICVYNSLARYFYIKY